MTYSIIGAGNVGTALARQFARSGIAVNIANTRGVDSLAELAKELGDHVTPVALEDALKAEVVILAVPFRSHASVAAALPDWSGKIVVDAMNTYGISPDELKEFLAGKFAKFWIPEGYAIIDAIPKTSVGKFLKSALRQRYEQELKAERLKVKG